MRFAVVLIIVGLTIKFAPLITFLNLGYHWLQLGIFNSVKFRFNESRFNKKSPFKVRNLVTKTEFHVKKSRFSANTRFKESKCADRGHSLN